MDTAQTNQNASGSAERCSRLIGIGTIHHDPAGYGLLKRLLDDLRPDLILIELSPYGYRYRKRHQREYLRCLLENVKVAAHEAGSTLRQAMKHPEIDAIRRQLAYPYEYRAARSYARLRGAAVSLVDDSLFSMRCILQWPALIETHNLVQLLRAPSRRLSVPGSYHIAHRTLCDRNNRSGWMQSTFTDAPSSILWNEREQVMAGRIQERVGYGRAKRPVFIGGWGHLVSSAQCRTLRTLLSLSPTQCRLLRGES